MAVLVKGKNIKNTCCPMCGYSIDICRRGKNNYYCPGCQINWSIKKRGRTKNRQFSTTKFKDHTEEVWSRVSRGMDRFVNDFAPASIYCPICGLHEGSHIVEEPKDKSHKNCKCTLCKSEWIVDYNFHDWVGPKEEHYEDPQLHVPRVYKNPMWDEYHKKGLV